MTRVIAWLATLALASDVLLLSPPIHRVAVCAIVSVGAITLVLRCLLTRRVIWALPFLGVLGMFTPFQISRFSPRFLTIIDMASLMLFAAVPLILKKTTARANL